MADDTKKKKSLFSRIIGWFKDTAAWIPEHLGDPAIARSIREDLGLKPGDEIPAEKNAKFTAFGSGLDPDKEGFGETVAEITAVAQEIKTLAATLETDDVPAGQVSYLIMSLAATDTIRLRLPALFAFARDILFFEDDTEKLMIIDPSRMLKSLRGEDLPSGEAFAQRLSMASALFLQLFDAFQSKEEDAQTGHVDVFYGWDLSPDSRTPKADLVQLRTTTFSIGDEDEGGGAIQVTMLYVPTEHGGPGLFLSFGGGLTVVKEVGTLKYRLDSGFSGGFDIYIPFGDGSLPLTVQGGGATPFLKFGISGGTPDEPAFRIGEPTGTRLDVYETELGIDVWKENAGIHAALRNAELVIVPGEGDSFLRDIAGDGAKIRFSVGFIADGDGFRLDGGTRATATLPVGRSISGLLTVHQITIGLGPSSNGGDFGLELSGAFTANIGPFAATVDRMGFQLNIARLKNGNFGPFDLGVGFKFPNGVGLVLDASLVKGGGYLYADPVNGEYAGALEIQFGSFSLKAIGAITVTEDSWSLILFVYGQFPPIQLGFGFTLDGVGGMIGIRHGVDVPQLVAGMKTGAFDDILFPANPIADAPRILNRLRTLFPPSPTSLTIGPMVDLGYGTPRIVFIRLAVLFQIDNVFGGSDDVSLARVVLLGQLRVEIGKTKADSTVSVVKLIVDILGFWDFEKKRYGFLAALRDSKIAGIDILGGLGVWGDYGDEPRFLLAAGGFNARFKDVPAEISGAIPRLGAAFKVGRFSLTLVGYFALTPGTVQFGVELNATAKIGPVGIKGIIGFDVLIYRTPYTHFIADFRIVAEITFKGHSLAGVKCIGTVEGPGLWHVVGKVSFSILWWDIDKSFDDSWGELPAAAIPAANVRELLQAELARRENWSAQLPASTDAMVTLAPRPGETVPLAHPLGRFAFSQRVVPLGLTLEHFDTATITGPNKFDITSLIVGQGAVPTRVPVREHFARAQFIEVSEEEKLTRPSFEEMESGVEFSSDAFRTSASVVANDMEYETAYLDVDVGPFHRTRRDIDLRKVAVDHDLIAVLSLHGAAARAPQRAEELMRARTGTIIAISAAPLAAADRTSFAADTAVAMAGQARSVSIIAEQRFKPADEQRSQLVEAFELALV